MDLSHPKEINRMFFVSVNSPSLQLQNGISSIISV